MKLEDKYVPGAPVRHIFMIGLIWHLANKGKTHLNILEIGSWYGASALTWAQGLKEHMESKGRITCVDAWEGEAKDSYESFRKNIKTVDNILIKTYLGKSKDILPSLEEKSYDIIYIDGDHTFKGVSEDIRLSCQLLKPDGILCGDDLNLQYSQIDQERCRSRHAEDVIRDPYTGKKYHPGVTLAVHTQIGRVTNYAGFWCMQNSPNNWLSVDLKDMPVIYPEHFSEAKIAEAKEHWEDMA